MVYFSTEILVYNSTVNYNKAVIDNSENTVREASKLSDLIIKDERIKALAENPLLLTTLLFVKRWAGYLPTKRSILYQEMIKLLLVTWNVEGHGILDIEETEPQLAFVAYWMTKNGKQTISGDDLNKCLIAARKQLPEILGYTNITPSEFIKRVESRSSLLIMAGYNRTESGLLTPMYQFLHLSFQEYLTAKAIVKKYIPQSDSRKKILDILKPNISSGSWKEIIPLVAVLLERETKDLINYLIAASNDIPLGNIETNKRISPSSLLGSCLANEIQINPDTLDSAIECFAKNRNQHIDKRNLNIILKNKFGKAFRKKVKECFFEKYDDQYAITLGSILSDIYLDDLKHFENLSTIPNNILASLKNKSKEEKCLAILGTMKLCFNHYVNKSSFPFNISILNQVFDEMIAFLKVNDPFYNLVIPWSIVWAIKADLFPNNLVLSFVYPLVKLWIESEEDNQNRITSWALTYILIPTIDKIQLSKIKKIASTIQERYSNPKNKNDKHTALYLGLILGFQFDKDEVRSLFMEKIEIDGNSKYALPFAEHFNIDLSNFKNIRRS